MTDHGAALARLEATLRGIGPLAVAVSGGVDSMTLAVVAHRALDGRARMFHAVSPAVPPQATERVRRWSAREGWALEILDAGEFADARYMANPANRCFFCKTNLYGSMSGCVGGVLVSGTNLDDLGDYRPGLKAADDHAVRHPWVEAGIDKAGVRAIARGLGLDDLAELPAAPCLSSRIETGIAIDPAVLGVVNDVERMLVAALEPRTARCRVRRATVEIELDAPTLESIGPERRTALAEDIAGRFARIGVGHPVSFSPYRMGSAFLRIANE